MQQAHPVSVDALRSLVTFAQLPDQGLQQLVRSGTVRKLKTRQRLSSAERDGTEHYSVVLEGMVAIARDAESSLGASAPSPGRTATDALEYLGVLGPGAWFSDAFLGRPPSENRPNIDCIAASPTMLLEVGRPVLAALMAKHTAWSERLGAHMATVRAQFLAQQEPSRRVVQDFFLRHGFATSSAVRVGRLDLCLDCNKCQDACAARHGTTRVIRAGPRLGRLTFPIVCQTCQDRACLAACKLGAMAVDDVTGDVRITELCQGCGACARKCPHGAIKMVELAVPRANARTDLRRLQQEAVKCDHCAGFSDRACLSACPVGGIWEAQPSDIFLEATAQASVSPSFLAAPFRDVPESSAVGAKRSSAFWTWTAVVTLVALVGIGLEAFLRRALPEYSLMAAYLRATGQDVSAVTYGPGRGYGHWLGYIGAGLMLLTLLYSLRTRIDRFRGLGTQTGWLSAHLWVGLVGATLVTYHATFKLDRWASIALYLMWTVLLTGALGRYVYGRVHSGVSVAEFELRALRRRSAWLREYGQNSRAVRALLGKEAVESSVRVPLVVMLWQELRDRSLLLWLRMSGIPGVADGNARRELVRALSEWSAGRRSRAFYQSARPVLRHWNIVHIVLAIAMFILAGIHIVYGFVYKAV